MKIQNTFSLGTVNKDGDERVVPIGALVDSENFSVNTSNGSDQGVGKSIPGNLLKSAYGIIGGKTIGAGSNPSKNKVYNFVSGSEFDYIIEYDTETETSVVVLQSTIGGVLNFDPNKRIPSQNVNIYIDADGNGDLLSWSGDNNPPRIVNIERAKLWGIDGFTDEEISVMKRSPIFAPTISLTTSVDGVANNFMRDKFLCFATRYKYADGFFSAPSSWTRVAFEPSQFVLDYQTYENNGMINLSNAVNLGFNVGPREVVQVDLLFRESNSQDIYVIEEFDKEEFGWDNDTVQSFQFSKSKIFTKLAEDQFFRNFDNVPLQAYAQAQFGNRLGYGNYLEGRDLGVNIDFDVEVVSEPSIQDEIEGVQEDFVDSVDYSNVVDFSRGNEDGGSSPVDQMNYETNTIEMDLSGAGGTNAEFVIEITPRPTFNDVEYSIFVKEGATTLDSWTELTGPQTRTYSVSSDKNVKIYVTSNEGMLYACKLNYNIEIIGTFVSKYDYFSDQQLAYPKSTGYGSTLVGNTVIQRIVEFDMASFVFESGKQIRINFEMQSSLSFETQPSVTFFYNITENYSNLADFLANSSFINQLEDVFSLTFENSEISNIGTKTAYEGFYVFSMGSLLSIRTPKVVYNVTDPGATIVSKTEFYLITDANIVSTTQNAFTSLHSNRDYEVAMIYMDEQGRKTTALNCPNNTVHIPADNSDLTNKLQVTVNNDPPSWAKYYKFAIKQPQRDYEIIYGNVVYKDGVYRYIQLVGENKGKVKEGDVLILKSDYSGPLETEQEVKVLEVKDQQENFLSGNLLPSGEELKELPGVYMKIKQGNFNINIDQDSFITYQGTGGRRYASRSFVSTDPLFGFYDGVTWVPTEVKAGTQIRFYIWIRAYRRIAFSHTLEIKVTAQEDYADMYDWFNAEIAGLSEWINYADDCLKDWDFGTSGNNDKFRIKPWRDGTQDHNIYTTVQFDVNFAGGTLVFETSPIEQLESPFFETPETYTITDGAHEFTVHTLNEASNCFSFGNGVESYRIQDTLTGKSFGIDSNPTDISPEGYKQIRRFADITYSGTYNSNTDVNKLNEFNLSLGNFKDDIVKAYGAIIKMVGFETNLEVIQEDKYSIVYYGKDLLYNADGTTNLARIEEVLGQQDTLNGEYGISSNADSFDFYGFDRYFTDVKRGVVLKKSNNGLFEISFQGMRDYFKKLFRDNTINHINGKYDQFFNYYILNIQYNDDQFVTWTYSDKDNGWTMRQSFNPEDMIRCNNRFFSFKNGEIYEHNQAGDNDNYNTFYGVNSPSTFQIFLNQEPSTRKNFKAISIEGSSAWDLVLKTDLNDGYIDKNMFEKKENVYWAYIRTSNSVIDTALLANQGIGTGTVSGLTITFPNDLDTFVSVGDQIRDADLNLVGTIQSKTTNSVTLDTMNSFASGDFAICSKPQSIANGDILGYYCKVSGTLETQRYDEIFSVNSEIIKSYQ
jgi:hypothetical protein